MHIKLHRGAGPLQEVIEIGAHRLLADASVAAGGEDSGPEPHDLLAAALGACTAITVRMVARRRGYQLDDVEVLVEHGPRDGGYHFQRTIKYIGALAEEEKARLTDIANKCPVHKTLQGSIHIDTTTE